MPTHKSATLAPEPPVDQDSPLTYRLAALAATFAETPLVRLDDERIELYAKLEYCNPNGSSKDRSAFWILKRAIERGEITRETTVVESSSGNFAISMAAFCRALGIGFVPVIDPNCNALTEAYLDIMCDSVEKVTERDASGGFLNTRLARVRELCRVLPHAYWPNQYANDDALTAHYELTGGEIARMMPELDYVFLGVSTGGTIAGLSRRVKETYPSATVVAVDAAGSAIFGQPPATRRLPGLGSSLVPQLCERALIDHVVIVPEARAVRGCLDLVRRHGLYTGGSTGSVYAAIEHWFTEHPPAAGERPRVAFLCADRGIAYADTVYNPAWVAAAFGTGTPPAAWSLTPSAAL
ncbi:2,3-diaminopropionate biosynthesis protein SbnA [Streptomyces tateyamensis]|uniref:2,3-diaminopropionate biosynthesis protein SbnA n=1 Tax=Streptomyces tateyamensis TaxID=565073 RepID=A0A2V4PQZ5_9ACTN|nr:2,3-diaminopropionate biosynthesis protein SbnA [Streptomyces tateyamensis]PYC87364.1 2,3-diaminopropionate biosynthesis protein SbnA [Streptomyces tateyamensis]